MTIDNQLRERIAAMLNGEAARLEGRAANFSARTKEQAGAGQWVRIGTFRDAAKMVRDLELGHVQTYGTGGYPPEVKG